MVFAARQKKERKEKRVCGKVRLSLNYSARFSPANGAARL